MAERTIVTLGDTLAALVEGKKYTTLRDILVTMNAVDVAAVFEDMPQDKLPLLFRLLPKELAAETFVEMAPEAQELLIQGFSDNELKEVVDELLPAGERDVVHPLPKDAGKPVALPVRRVRRGKASVSYLPGHELVLQDAGLAAAHHNGANARLEEPPHDA